MSSLSPSGRALVLGTAFAGWLFAGFHMAITSLAMRPAAIDLLARTGQLDRERFRSAQQLEEAKNLGSLPVEEQARYRDDKVAVSRWFAWYTCAFLFGAAAGGLIFGRLGDRLGRATGMGLSILAYSLFAAGAAASQAPWQLLVLWFLACLGVGGMWPTGVALVSEAWSELSRPLVAGLIGTSANVGIFGLATLAVYVHVTPEEWRWIFLIAGSPVALGVLVLLAVPESPLWLAQRQGAGDFVGVGGRGLGVGAEGKRTDRPHATQEPYPASDFPQPPTPNPQPPNVFRPPLLPVTLVAIALATVPMVGGWGSANWMVPWADTTGPALKANVSQARSLTGIVGSLLGGWIAAQFGRRRSYCLVSLAALFCAQYTFWLLTPADASFLFWVSALGFFSGVYFGWMPLFLPELFPTAVRSTGAGVGFNFGRILTAVTIFLTGVLMAVFDGDYARIGRVTSVVYLAGAVVVWLAPDTTRRRLDGVAGP